MASKKFILDRTTDEKFRKLFTRTRLSNEQEDMKGHWDVEIITKIEVKGLKKQNREDVMATEHFHWLEFVNGIGETGSLYGDSDFFALELEDCWCLIETSELQKFAEEKTKGKKVGKCKDPYELYQRDNRKDVITKVKTIDLMRIAARIINK